VSDLVGINVIAIRHEYSVLPVSIFTSGWNVQIFCSMTDITVDSDGDVVVESSVYPIFALDVLDRLVI